MNERELLLNRLEQARKTIDEACEILKKIQITMSECAETEKSSDPDAYLKQWL